LFVEEGIVGAKKIVAGVLDVSEIRTGIDFS
jgi:hypothetical protein